MQVDAEKLPVRLQQDINPLKRLMPLGALFSDADSIPGIHCPIPGLSEEDINTPDSLLVRAMRGCNRYRISMKE